MTLALAPVGAWIRRDRPVLLAWLLLLLTTATPYIVAALAPPRDTTFTGFFFYSDDQFNYLAHSQQAENGSFLFRNKLLLTPHEPGLLNIEWWLVGRLSAILGGSPLLANRLITAPLLLLFLLAIDRWLCRLGLASELRLSGLLLVAFGGGSGWLLHVVFGRDLGQCPDIATGLYPFQLSLSNSHFLFGITILVWAFLLADDARPSRRWAAILLATVVGLSRPYDMISFGLVRGAAVLVGTPWRRWLSGMLPLFGLLPAALLNYWMFYRGPSHGFYAAIPYVFPPALHFLIALLPPALLLLPALLRGWRPREGGALLLATALWLAFVGCMVIFRPLEFWAQFVVGAAVPLLVVAAVAFSSFGARALRMAGASVAGNAVFLTWLVLQPTSRTFAPAEQVAAARAFRIACQSGDLALAPPLVGLWLSAYSACTPYVSHAAAPANAVRLDVVNGFYGDADPEARRRILESLHVRHVLLPGDAPAPTRWLGTAPFFRRLTVGSGTHALSIYTRKDVPPSDASPADPG